LQQRDPAHDFTPLFAFEQVRVARPQELVSVADSTLLLLVRVLPQERVAVEVERELQHLHPAPQPHFLPAVLLVLVAITSPPIYLQALASVLFVDT